MPEKGVSHVWICACTYYGASCMRVWYKIDRVLWPLPASRYVAKPYFIPRDLCRRGTIITAGSVAANTTGVRQKPSKRATASACGYLSGTRSAPTRWGKKTDLKKLVCQPLGRVPIYS